MPLTSRPASMALTLLVALAGGALAGCQSTPTTASRGEAARGAVQKFRDGLTRAVAQVNLTTATLGELMELKGDLKEKYAEFDYAVASVEKQAAIAKERREELVAKRAQYLEQWEKELAASPDPDIKQRMTMDRANAEKDFERLIAAVQKARDSYTPWIEGLRSVRTALAGDKLAPAAVAALRPVGATTQQHGGTLQAQLLAVLFEVDRMARLRAARLEQ